MNWREQLENYEHEKSWESAIELMGKIIKENPSSAEAYVRTMYLLLNILLEEDYPVEKHDSMANLLRNYFDESYPRFSDNAEYLFFMGYFISLAEWHFGQDDLTLADQMKEKASALEPDNILYEWSWRFSQSDPLAGYFVEQLLKYDVPKIEWLKSKGAPGAYILDVIDRTYKEYKRKAKASE